MKIAIGSWGYRKWFDDGKCDFASFLKEVKKIGAEGVEIFPHHLNRTNTAQALVNAMVRALRFIQASTPDQIIAAVPPESYADRALYKAALEKNLDGFKHDGFISAEAGQNVLRDLKSFDPTVQNATVDVAKTVNMTFQQKAAQKFR